MTERGVNESVVEEAALAWLESIGWQIAHGPDVAPPCLPAGTCPPPSGGRPGVELANSRHSN